MEMTEISDLKGFKIEKFTEVYKIDDRGFKKYFKDENIAVAFAEMQTDASWLKTKKVFVLTNGKVAFLLGESIEISDDEEAILEIKKRAFSKLSSATRKVLEL